MQVGIYGRIVCYTPSVPHLAAFHGGGALTAPGASQNTACIGHSATASASVVLPPSTSGAVPGAIPGGFSVGTQGDASYTIPITVPAGTGGLRPSLALSYNHLAGNGLAGMRWTLAGVGCELPITPERAA
jgi:hypothetical protein